MKELKAIILIGLPASGKSTWCKDFLKDNPKWIRINRDDFRFMFRNEPTVDWRIEELITDLQLDVVRKAFRAGFNVVFDNTHLKQKYFKSLVEQISVYASIEFVLLDVPIEICLERDALREKKVGEEVIRKMNNDLSVLKKHFKFEPVPKKINSVIDSNVYVWNRNPELPDAVGFDIDGTIALMGDRSPFDWKNVGVDAPIFHVIEQVQLQKKAGRTVILISGRDDEGRDATIEWLNRFDIPFDFLFMRKNKDNRKDSIIKEEIYLNEIKDKYNFLYHFDDRLQVLTKWYELGVFTFNVNQGNREF